MVEWLGVLSKASTRLHVHLAEPGQSRILQQSWLSPAHKRLHAAELFGLPETTSGDEVFTPRNPHLRHSVCPICVCTVIQETGDGTCVYERPVYEKRRLLGRDSLPILGPLRFRCNLATAFGVRYSFPTLDPLRLLYNLGQRNGMSETSI